MKNLRELIHPYLKSIHPRLYFQDAPDNAQFPYLVYDFTQIVNDGEEFETVAVDVDGWDMPANGDTTALETLMQTVNDALNKKTLTAEGLAVTFYLDRKMPLRDDNKDIRRRKYIYEARLFGRS
ncbi:tail completion protein gp17 [Acetivibrio straminisolvens]|jgi:hypothetical protein|uniref:tail completion protein gp17 n=1 Tax=Acetivibrio straminisolvens TaxID=253314 RepID=UPI00223EA8B1|nr:hypothetical protein [Acetivibrio straminisolvens]